MITDYQLYDLENGIPVNIGERMAKKLQAIPIPDLTGKSVLDVGCDTGFWCWQAANKGASKVVGIDRNREVRGHGYTDLVEQNNKTAKFYKNLEVCSFQEMNLGKQWMELGKFDYVFMFSMYHHAYENCGDHKPIWFWLWRHLNDEGQVIWENPTETNDAVVQLNVSEENRNNYTQKAIFQAASRYFEIYHIGPALHEPTREVYRFVAKKKNEGRSRGLCIKGHGGAAPCFRYANGRRRSEIQDCLGMRPIAGSVNVKMFQEFDWEHDYYRARILDIRDREKGFISGWWERQARFYPITVDGKKAFAFRFEGEIYPTNLVELISDQKIKNDGMIELCL